jgi:hypothetical protein
LLVFGAFALATGTAWADEIVLRPSGSHFGPQGDGSVILVRLVNETALQGLQFRLDYDPAVARPVAVTGLGRLGDPQRLQYHIDRGTIRGLVCDLSTACTSIAPGDDPIVSVAFDLLDNTHADTLRVSMGDALEVTESLAARSVAGTRIAIPISRSAVSAEKPAGGRAGAVGLAGGDAAGDVPTRFALQPAGPNPSSTGTILQLAVPRAAHVRVTVYDTRGRLVRVLSDRFMEAGRHTVHWDGATNDGTRAGAGLFFVRAAAEGFVINRKIIALQ